MELSQIKRRWDEADAAERKGDDLHYRVAADLAAAADAGASYRQLGAETGRSHQLVGWFVRVHRTYGKSGVDKPDSFNQAILAIRGVSNASERVRKDESAMRKVIRDRPERVAEAIANASPDVQKQIADFLVASQAEASLRKAVKPGPRPEPKVPMPENKLGEALFLIWEAGELLLDHAPSDEERIRMLNQADKVERLASGIRHALDVSGIDAEFETLVREMAAER
jgi:hypothetical protein